VTVTDPTWDVARERARSCGAPLSTERVPLADADGRFLAEPITARTALPVNATSAMDGWAVAGPGPWTAVGEVLAGQTFARMLEPGEAVAIATGAVPPPGTMGVLRSERSSRDGSGRIMGDVVPAQDLRPAAEEADAGEVLIAAGTRMTPAHVGLAAAAGVDDVLVRRRPRAAVLVFGDELLTSGPSRDGRVRDSLGPQIPAWLRRLGIDALRVVHVEDTLEAHVNALNECVDVDLVVTTGGTAAGPVDHLRAAIAATDGHLVVDRVAVRPGHPMLLGMWGTSRWILGLPGNPQSAVVALVSLGIPLVESLHASPQVEWEYVETAHDVTAPAAETRLLAAQRRDGKACAVSHLGSAMLRGLAAADGFAIIPPGGVAAGASVRWLSLPA
jgi:molybdopterin molybdotransferase